MPRRPQAHERIRTELIHAGAVAETVEAYGDAVLLVLERAIGCDSARLFGIDPGTLLLNRLIAATGGDEPFRGYWLRNIYLAGPDESYFAPHELMRAGSRATLYRDDQTRCRGVPAALLARLTERGHTAHFHETRTPAGGSLRLCLRARGAWIGMLDVVRRDRGHPVADAAFVLMRDLGRVIAAGLDAALLREAVRQPERGQRSPGIVVLASDQSIAYRTPSADRWIAALYDRDAQPTGDLATPFWAVAAAARNRREPGAPVSLVAPSAAGPLRLDATDGEAPGSIAIVISPLRPTGAFVLPGQWQLTERQRAIVELLLRGCSTKEIAERLFIGVPTVETHLGHIYAALGISGRHELLAAYFQLAILPTMDAEGRPQG